MTVSQTLFNCFLLTFWLLQYVDSIFGRLKSGKELTHLKSLQCGVLMNLKTYNHR